MTFPVKDYEEIKGDILRDISNLEPMAAVGADSDFNVRASGVAAAIEGGYQYQQWISRQILPDTADTEWLERHAFAHGLSRKPASFASGSVTFSGNPGAVIAHGTEVKTPGAVVFKTTAPGVVGVDGTVTILVTASAAGTGGNLPNLTPFTLTSSPIGVASSSVADSAMTGGADVEANSDLLARLLDILRNPPAGGNKADYKRWALEVPGVGVAFVYPMRRGLGTVDVVVLTNEYAIPSELLITSVQDYIDLNRPVTADFMALAPTAISVDVTANIVLSGVLLADVVVYATALLNGFFKKIKPGEIVYKSQLSKIILSIDGVVDVDIVSPLGNVEAIVDSERVDLLVLGVVDFN